MISWAFLFSLALAEAQGCFRLAVEQNGSGVTVVSILGRAKCTFWTLFCHPICVLYWGLCMVSILLSGLLLSVFLESVEVQTSWKESLVPFFFSSWNPCFQFFLNLTANTAFKDMWLKRQIRIVWFFFFFEIHVVEIWDLAPAKLQFRE